jgi:hypothetical protein
MKACSLTIGRIDLAQPVRRHDMIPGHEHAFMLTQLP